MLATPRQPGRAQGNEFDEDKKRKVFARDIPDTRSADSIHSKRSRSISWVAGSDSAGRLTQDGGAQAPSGGSGCASHEVEWRHGSGGGRGREAEGQHGSGSDGGREPQGSVNDDRARTSERGMGQVGELRWRTGGGPWMEVVTKQRRELKRRRNPEDKGSDDEAELPCEAEESGTDEERYDGHAASRDTDGVAQEEQSPVMVVGVEESQTLPAGMEFSTSPPDVTGARSPHNQKNAAEGQTPASSPPPLPGQQQPQSQAQRVVLQQLQTDQMLRNSFKPHQPQQQEQCVADGQPARPRSGHHRSAMEIFLAGGPPKKTVSQDSRPASSGCSGGSSILEMVRRKSVSEGPGSAAWGPPPEPTPSVLSEPGGSNMFVLSSGRKLAEEREREEREKAAREKATALVLLEGNCSNSWGSATGALAVYEKYGRAEAPMSAPPKPKKPSTVDLEFEAYFASMGLM